MTEFTPYSALLGGFLIGGSAALLLWTKGRIAGISGIVGGIIIPEKNDVAWRVIFVIGLVLGGFVYQWLGGSIEQIGAPVSRPWLILAAILVGVGTTMGSGCTSGHGICGIARLSPRSLVATSVFMSTGFVAVFIVRHLLGV